MIHEYKSLRTKKKSIYRQFITMVLSVSLGNAIGSTIWHNYSNSHSTNVVTHHGINLNDNIMYIIYNIPYNLVAGIVTWLIYYYFLKPISSDK